MNASVLYKELISDISSLMKAEGFLRKGNRFCYQLGNNWGLLDFQKSRDSTVDQVIFTINIGTCSGRLLEFFSPDLSKQKPTIAICHWRERIGFLLPLQQDKWWSIQTNDLIDPLTDQIRDLIVQNVIPSIKQYITDHQRCSKWLSGKSPGLTDIQRLLNLCVLLKMEGMYNAFHEVLKELDDKSTGRPVEIMIRRYLKKLEQIG